MRAAIQGNQSNLDWFGDPCSRGTTSWRFTIAVACDFAPTYQARQRRLELFGSQSALQSPRMTSQIVSGVRWRPWTDDQSDGDLGPKGQIYYRIAGDGHRCRIDAITAFITPLHRGLNLSTTGTMEVSLGRMGLGGLYQVLYALQMGLSGTQATAGLSNALARGPAVAS